MEQHEPREASHGGRAVAGTAGRQRARPHLRTGLYALLDHTLGLVRATVAKAPLSQRS